MNRFLLHARMVGRRGPVLQPIAVECGGTIATGRELLASVVRHETAAFRERQDARRLIRMLTETQLGEQLETGRVSFGGDDLSQPVDTDAAIQAALTAFEDRFFYVFLNDVPLETLDATIELVADTQVLFLRLVPLVGG